MRIGQSMQIKSRNTDALPIHFMI